MSGALASLSRYSDSESESETPADAGQDHVASTPISDTDPQLRRRAKSIVRQSGDPSADRSNRPKRKLPPLVSGSFGQESDEEDVASNPGPAGNNRKKLMRGDWLCYCFVEVLVGPALRKVIQDAHVHIQEKLGTDLTLLDLRNANVTLAEAISNTSTNTSSEILHVSLTRPFTVRSHERDEYIKIAAAELERLAATTGSFSFSFSRFACLANDDASSHFVVLEIGPGREKLHKLSAALSTELRRAFRAKSYYEEPRFHASTACLQPPNITSNREGRPEQSVAELGLRLERVVASAEGKWGRELRKCPPNWSRRVGIQVANKVTYIDL